MLWVESVYLSAVNEHTEPFSTKYNSEGSPLYFVAIIELILIPKSTMQQNFQLNSVGAHRSAVGSEKIEFKSKG